MTDSAASDGIRTLAELRQALARCKRCPLYRHATQAVPGEGPVRASLMLVGEVPGNDEDIDGRPFVGPAGRVLDRALGDAGLERRKIFITNAVKHFKFERRGKRRLHKRPSAAEIDVCKHWNEIERALVKPDLTVALGATAARSLLGGSATVGRLRGRAIDTPHGAVFVTVHPSFLLRIPDEADKAREYRSFVTDLKRCRAHIERRG